MLPHVESKEARGSTSDRPALPRAPAELCSDGAKPMLHMHAAGWEVERADTAGRLQSGSRARRGEAGSSYTAQSKSPWTGLRQKEELGEMKEQSKLSVPTPARPLPFLQ